MKIEEDPIDTEDDKEAGPADLSDDDVDKKPVKRRVINHRWDYDDDDEGGRPSFERIKRKKPLGSEADRR